MMQFNTVVCIATTKFISRVWWRLSIPFTTNTASIPAETINRINKEITSDTGRLNLEKFTNFKEFKTRLCNSLNIKPSVVTKIQNAKSVEDIMKVTETSLLSQENIIKLKQAIEIWINQNNGTKGNLHNNRNTSKETENIQQNSFNIISHDDIISKYSDLSTSGMIKEIYNLAQKNQRNVPVLKYLYQNILEFNEILSPGECSSLMYSMSRLSYSDERLLQKTCNDLIQGNGMVSMHIMKLLSILKSMASVRYKNDIFLGKVCKRIEQSNLLYTDKQVVNVLMSLAMLGYESKYVNNIVKKYLPHVQMNKLSQVDWLNFVWSLLILNVANSDHIKSVLENVFIEKLMALDSKQNLSHTLKLLNINGYANSILKDYSGPFLSDTVPPIMKSHSKQKELYVNALETTLTSILPSSSHFKMNINTKMGFLLDAELHMDSNFRPVQVGDVKDDHTKIAVMILDYYDLCLGTVEPQGLVKLYQRLLISKKYQLLCIPYQHFGIEDKIEKRISYLKRQLWTKYK